MAWEKCSASTIPCLAVWRAYRSNQPPSSGETTAVVPSLSVNVTNCLSGMMMRDSIRRLDVEEHGQTVRQHRRKLSEGRVFVTWMFGVLLDIDACNEIESNCGALGPLPFNSRQQ